MKKTVFLALCAMLFWNCNNSKNTDIPQQVTNTVAIEENNQDLVETITLDNGQKWVVNSQMRPFIEQGEQLVNAYISNGDSDYLLLAQNLKQTNTELIKSCTMTGKSHDQLHLWLHPHIQIVEALSKQSDLEQSNQIINQLQQSYNQYHVFFE